jgi:class 3 adenylate cyclase/tetratricopeptide (TPR) repeat protein
MECSTCHTQNLPDSRFCIECGTTLDATCPSCTASNPPRAKFCRKCGTPLGQAPGPGSTRSPVNYTPQHLAEKILTSRTALAGERKPVTVLFADVKGSMELAESLDPEAWHRVMDRFFVILTDAVHHFEGTINQYTGDGIMALFGAPIAHEDHARRACYAALRLTEGLRQYAEELRRTQGLNFSVRMGLNSGEVVVGKIGDDLRMDYTAQGHTVGLAARMEQLAAPDRVYLTAYTAALVSGFFRLRDLGRFTLKGVREPVRVYELEGAGPLRTRLELARARGLSRFVGRAQETAALEAALARALAGEGQVIGIVGDAGVGKSRLCYEFTQQCRGRGLAVYEAHAVAHGKMIPFLPLLEILRSYFAITERDTAEEARRKIAGTVLLLDKELTETLPLLFDFFAVPDPNQRAAHRDAEVSQRQLRSVLKQLLLARGGREPSVFVFEDLHWFDRGSEVLLEALVEATPAARTLLLVNFRPEYHAAWMQRSCYQQLPLLPFDSEAIAALLRVLLGTDSSLAGLPDLIRQRTRGNPFFVEEIVQALVDAGNLEGTKGAYRLVRPVREIAIPATVQAVLAARIDRLAEREKTVLQTAAVIGEQFAEPVLRLTLKISEAELAAALRPLTEAEFIYEDALFPVAEYAFKHPLTREVAYHAQLGDRRARVHGAVAHAMTELYADKLHERAALLAHHWEAAGEVLEAARHHRSAAQWVGTSNFPAALRHWRKVRTLVSGLPQSDETIELTEVADSAILGFGVRLGAPEEEKAALLAELTELAARTGTDDVRSRTLLLCAPAAVKTMGGEAEQAIAALRDASSLAEQGDDAGLKLAIRAFLALAYRFAGRLREGLACAEQGLSYVPEDAKLGAEIFGLSPWILLLTLRGILLREMGRPNEAALDLDRAAELARQHGELELLSIVYGNHVGLDRLMGEVEPALPRARSAMEAAEKIGNPFSRAEGYTALGQAHMLRREWREAAAALEQALAITRETRAGLSNEPSQLALLAEVELHRGDGASARALADEAIDAARERNARSAECHALVTAARVFLGTEGVKMQSAVETALGQALALVEETGATSYEPFIHAELAELARLTGHAATRERELREAHRLFTAMGATRHAARIAQELA